MINPALFIMMVSFIIVSVKASSYLEPFNLYYTFTTLFIDSKTDAYSWALLIKLAIPFIVGFLVLSAAFTIAKRISPSSVGKKMESSCEYNGAVSAYYSGFFGAFVLAWPMILYWDILASPEIWPHRKLLVFIYILYFFSYGFLCSAGSKLAIAIAVKKERKERKERKSLLYFDSIRDSFIGAAGAGVATLLLSKLS
jgi:hypothetical protein